MSTTLSITLSFSADDERGYDDVTDIVEHVRARLATLPAGDGGEATPLVERLEVVDPDTARALAVLGRDRDALAQVLSTAVVMLGDMDDDTAAMLDTTPEAVEAAYRTAYAAERLLLDDDGPSRDALCSDCYRDRVLADPVFASNVDDDYDGPDMGDGIGFAPGVCAACGRRGVVFDVVEPEPVDEASVSRCAHCGAAGHHADEARA